MAITVTKIRPAPSRSVQVGIVPNSKTYIEVGMVKNVSPFQICKMTRFKVKSLSIPGQHKPGQSGAGALWSLGQETQAKDMYFEYEMVNYAV